MRPFRIKKSGLLCKVAFYGRDNDDIPGDIGMWTFLRLVFANLVAVPFSMAVRGVSASFEPVSNVLFRVIGGAMLFCMGLVVALAVTMTLVIGGGMALLLIFAIPTGLLLVLFAIVSVGFLFAMRLPKAVDGYPASANLLVPYLRWPEMAGHRVYPLWPVLAIIWILWGPWTAVGTGLTLCAVYGLMMFLGTEKYSGWRKAVVERLFPTVELTAEE